MSARRVTVRNLPKASAVGREKIAPLALIFERLPLDIAPGFALGDLRDWYRREARTMLDAMDIHCSQGFTDALFAEMAHRKASALRVAKPALRKRGRQ